MPSHQGNGGRRAGNSRLVWPIIIIHFPKINTCIHPCPKYRCPQVRSYLSVTSSISSTNTNPGLYRNAPFACSKLAAALSKLRVAGAAGSGPAQSSAGLPKAMSFTQYGSMAKDRPHIPAALGFDFNTSLFCCNEQTNKQTNHFWLCEQ